MTTNWDPTTMILEAREWPLPPPDNHCHSTGRYGRYPTKEYATWLEIVAPELRRALGDWVPDTEHWWWVSGFVSLGMRPGDGPNYIKATLDAFSGACVRAGKIEKPGGLWDDDRRCQIGPWLVQWVRDPEPTVTLMISTCCGPRDYRDEQAAAAKALRDAERARARELREAVKAAERTRKAELRAAAKAARSR